MVNRPAALRLLLAVCLSALAMPGAAQTPDQQPEPEPAHLAYLDGDATVVRDGRAETATINVPLIAGDQLRTREGRVEVLFGDGSALDADHFTSVDFLSDSLVRLLEGRIHVTIGGRDRVAYRIDTPAAAVRIDAPGEYRIALVGDSGRTDVELTTIRGYATLVNEQGETPLRAGERAFASTGMAPSYAQAYNSAKWDAFDRWTADRRDERTGAISAQYLPEDVRLYASDFDRYGDWRYENSYGYVWYPRVRVDWRPYSYGRWSYYGPWGWTWIAYDRWGWPTHHYGRWGFNAGAWFWIPTRHWAPAYVYWAGASDYIGWCPLGWDDRPIFNIVNVNINVGRGYRGYGGFGPYHAWTVVPRRAFASHVDVARYAVNRADLDRAVPRWYVSGPTAPVRPGVATRTSAPIYSAGRTAYSRGGSGTVSPVAPQRSAPRAYGSGGSISGWNATTPSGAAAPGAPERAAPRAMPRGTAPRSEGTLGPSTSWPRYRDMGPGGQDPPRAVDRAAPREVGAPRGVPDDGSIGARRGVPDNSRIYAPRGVPRDGGISGPGGSERSVPQRDASPMYRQPMRERPEGYGAPGYGAPERSGARERSAPPGWSAPRERPAPREWSAPRESPPRGPAPGDSAPSGPTPRGGGYERAAPRGDSAAPAAPAPPRGSGGERAHSRRPAGGD